MRAILTKTVPFLFVLNSIFGLWVMFTQRQNLPFFAFSGSVKWIFCSGTVLTVFSTFYLLLQAVLAGCYRTKKWNGSPDTLPDCSILIPAFNEGKQVFKTIESVLNVNYPPEKMEIIAIDDGSADDTWNWIQRAVEKNPGRVRGLHQAKNSGKKRALCRGIAESSGEIIVTVDSDSVLEQDALRNLLVPFPQNEQIGAVAGNIRVRDRKSCLMARMLDVAFVFGCDFMRSAQSVIGMVLCTPGAISAYRRTAVEPLIKTWLDQTFLGAPSTIGEDRALTSLLLRNHWQVICQNNAVAWTEVPHRYGKLCRMLLRWTRGDVRESILLMGFVCSKWTWKDWKWCLFQLNIFSQIVGVLLPLVFIPCTFLIFILLREHLALMLYYTLSMNGIWSILPAVVYARRTHLSGAIWAFLYGIFSVIALSWICVYSVLTLRNSKWLTRGTEQKGRTRTAF